jgi:hypothetical protein
VQDEGHDAANALEGGDVVVGFDGHGRCVGCGGGVLGIFGLQRTSAIRFCSTTTRLAHGSRCGVR